MNFGIEVIGDAAYIFTETQPGFGGLPVGIEGLAGLYLDGEAAVLAGLLMMKRGCGLVAAGPFMDVALLERFLPDPPLRILAAATLAEAEAALASAGALALATAHRLPDAPPGTSGDRVRKALADNLETSRAFFPKARANPYPAPSPRLR